MMVAIFYSCNCLRLRLSTHPLWLCVLLAQTASSLLPHPRSVHILYESPPPPGYPKNRQHILNITLMCEESVMTLSLHTKTPFASLLTSSNVRNPPSLTSPLMLQNLLLQKGHTDVSPKKMERKKGRINMDIQKTAFNYILLLFKLVCMI